MKILRNRSSRLILILVPVGSALLFFQNCSPARVGTAVRMEAAKGGGTGTDGKLYASYGECPDGSVGESSVVKISDKLNALVLREDCQVLDTPQPVAVKDLKFAYKDSSVMLFKGRLYDRQMDLPKLTLAFCQSSDVSPTVEIRVWRVGGPSGVLYGKISRADGASSGILKVAVPNSSAPLDFVTESGQNSSFGLSLANPPGASLTYSLAGGPQTSVPEMKCLKQKPRPESGKAR